MWFFNRKKKDILSPKEPRIICGDGIDSLSQDGEKDELLEEAIRIICQYDRASASLLQRRLSIGYARAARILDQLEVVGAVGSAEGAKPREVLVKNPEEVLISISKQPPRNKPQPPRNKPEMKWRFPPITLLEDFGKGGEKDPNKVYLRDILSSEIPEKFKFSKTVVPLGKNMLGEFVWIDIPQISPCLIVGSPESGKMALLKVFIISLFFRTTPNEVRLILVDSKKTELTQYNGLPHLLTPVIVEVEKVVSALKWAISEMERRYKLFAQAGARNIDLYNELSGFQALPYIVIIIDELADIIFFAPELVEVVEDAIRPLAKMAGVTGIYLILSAKNLSLKLIKEIKQQSVNSIISFKLPSQQESIQALGCPGAEKLVPGDFLFKEVSETIPQCIEGISITDKEINKVLEFMKKELEKVLTPP